MNAYKPPVLAGIATALALATTAAYGAPATAASPSHPASHVSRFATSGDAFGSRVQVGSLVGSGESALTMVGCGATHITRRNATAHVNLSSLGQVRAVRTQSGTRHTRSGLLETVSRARTAGVSLLNGAIKLKALSSTAVARPRRHAALSGRSQFLGLRIGGKLMSAHPKPNTSLKIPGLVKLTVNAQRRTHVNGVRRITVDALKLTLLHGSKLGPLGTTVLVGQSSAALHNLRSSVLHGASSGSEITVGGLVTSSPTFRTLLPCGGTDGQVAHHRGVGIHLSKVLKTGVIRTLAKGSDGLTPSSSTRATIGKVNLLGGLIKARVLRAQANVTKVGGHVTRTNLGSHFIGLKINGKPMNDNISRNTKFSLLGIGTLWLDRVIKSPRGLQVHMIELVLGHKFNGMRRGTVIDIANARARVSR
jgi:hypothetical protein